MSLNEVTVPKPHPSYPRGWGGSGGGGTILACIVSLHRLKNRPIQALMGLFDAKIDPVKLLERLDGMDDTLKGLRRDVRSQELEYIELYDKVKRQMSRMAKRYAVDVAENNDAPVVEDPKDGLDPISRSIMLRRGLQRTR